MAIQDYYRPLTVQRKTTTPNGFGGESETWANHLSIEGLINQASSKEIVAAAQHQEDIDSKLFTDVGLDIKKDDRVVDSIEGNKVYRIVSVPKDTVNQGHHWKIMLRRVGTDG